MKLNKEHLKQVDRNISPPMAAAITIPVEVDGRDNGIAIYVMVSPFALMSNHQTAEQVIPKLTEIAERLKLE